jgi:hypothetical protein
VGTVTVVAVSAIAKEKWNSGKTIKVAWGNVFGWRSLHCLQAVLSFVKSVILL